MKAPVITPWSSHDIRHQYKGRVIAIGGPPHSGKSVFASKLYHQLLSLLSGSNTVFKDTACPDGEGMWSQEADPELVVRIRKSSRFTPEFMQHKLPGIERMGRDRPLVLIDIGGLRTAENAEILQRCTHLILISKDPEEFEPWQTFAAAEGCEAIALFRSHLIQNSDGSLDNSQRSQLQLMQKPATGELFNLSRAGSGETYQAAIAQIAHWLKDMQAL